MSAHWYTNSLAVRTAFCLPLLSPFQALIYFRPLNVSCLKIPVGEAGWLFNTLRPREDRASNIDGAVTIETGSRQLFSTLLISLYVNLPTLYLFDPRLAPYHLLRQIASPDGALSLA